MTQITVRKFKITVRKITVKKYPFCLIPKKNLLFVKQIKVGQAQSFDNTGWQCNLFVATLHSNSLSFFPYSLKGSRIGSDWESKSESCFGRKWKLDAKTKGRIKGKLRGLSAEEKSGGLSGRIQAEEERLSWWIQT